jgi:signal transduction histidine kinase
MRRRILLLVAGVTTAVVLAFAIPVGVLLNSAVAQRVERASLDQAEQAAGTVREGTRSVSSITAYVTSVSRSTGRPMTVTTPDGQVIGDSEEMPSEPLPARPGGGPGDRGPGGGGGGPDNLPQATLHSVPGGQEAEVFVQTNDGTYAVRVFVSNSALHAGVGKWWALLIGGSAGLLLLGIVAGEVLTRRIVRPLTRTAETAHLLATGDTSARAPTDGPREVADVGSALNRLADRIDELIAEERETVADLSHRLRTPLTVLRLDVEALQDPAEAERLSNRVGAVERTLTSVIHAARRPQREGRIPACDASAVVRERVTFWSALADDQGRRYRLELPDTPLPVRSSADDLAAALDALLENVIAHTDEGVAFAVRLWQADGRVHLEVSDDGPGIAEEALLRGRSDRGSTGLGLDIARRCAEAGGGSMSVGRGATGGAVVTLHLSVP